MTHTVPRIIRVLLVVVVAGRATAQLAILPGTTHVTLLQRTDWLVSMVTAFLDRPPA
jgi:hypothetical protein